MSMFFFFKQKTAYEMRISDWSSDVCSSDLQGVAQPVPMLGRRLGPGQHPEDVHVIVHPAHEVLELRRKRVQIGIRDAWHGLGPRKTVGGAVGMRRGLPLVGDLVSVIKRSFGGAHNGGAHKDRKSTRLNSSH